MLDIKVIRENPDRVKQAMKNRNGDYDEIIDRVLACDEKRRELNSKADGLKAEQNKASKQIPQIKKEGGDVSAILAEMNEIKAKVKDLDAEIAKVEAEQKDLILSIPNIPHESVPIGKSDEDNVEIRRWGEPKQFAFEPKAHWDIGKDLGILDPETAGKVTGARFHFYKGLGARLERSIYNFFLNTHTNTAIPKYFRPIWSTALP